MFYCLKNKNTVTVDKKMQNSAVFTYLNKREEQKERRVNRSFCISMTPVLTLTTRGQYRHSHGVFKPGANGRDRQGRILIQSFALIPID